MSSASKSLVSTNGHQQSTFGSTSRLSLTSTSPLLADPYPSHTENSVSSYEGANGITQSPYVTHHEEVVHHIYQQGFQMGNYADTLLHVHRNSFNQNSYRLHAIVLSRSPYLVHLMSTSPQSAGQRVIDVPLEHEPEVTQDGFAIALGYLYSALSLNNLRPENARGVLAAGCLLGGMDDLCGYAYEACRQNISLETIDEWLKFIDSIPFSDGAATLELPPPSVFGVYAQRLREDVLHFLVVTLPSVLDIHPTPSSQGAETAQRTTNGRDTLLQIFAHVPFELFKTAIESPSFQIGSEQMRFKFAKDAIDLRKRGIARGSGAEETVVLAFGGGNSGGSAVHVTRKLRRKALWKVNAS